MSCEKNPNRVSQAGSKAGISGPAARAAFYAGVGLATAGVAATSYGLWWGRSNRAYQQGVSEVVSKIQNGADLAEAALGAKTPAEKRQEILNDASYKVVEAWMQIKKMKDKDPLKGQLAHFAADVMGTMEDAESILNRPGNVADLDRVRKVFRSSQMVFLLPRRGRRNRWRTPLLLGGAAGLAAAGAAELAWRQRARRKLEER